MLYISLVLYSFHWKKKKQSIVDALKTNSGEKLFAYLDDISHFVLFLRGFHSAEFILPGESDSRYDHSWLGVKNQLFIYPGESVEGTEMLLFRSNSWAGASHHMVVSM